MKSKRQLRTPIRLECTLEPFENPTPDSTSPDKWLAGAPANAQWSPETGVLGLRESAAKLVQKNLLEGLGFPPSNERISEVNGCLIAY